jgi:hypothetical protein
MKIVRNTGLMLGKYLKEGQAIFALMPRVQDFGNGTIQLMNITAYGPKGKAVAALDEKFGGGQTGLLQVAVEDSGQGPQGNHTQATHHK